LSVYLAGSVWFSQ